MKAQILLASFVFSLCTSVALAQKLDCTKQDNGSFTCTEMTKPVNGTAVIGVKKTPAQEEFATSTFFGGMVSGVVGVLLIAFGVSALDSPPPRRSRGC